MDTSKIARYVWLGRKDVLWYTVAQTLFTDLFGADRIGLVTKLFAATSINTSLKSNITLFRKALYEIEKGKPIGKYLPNIQTQLTRIRAGEELSGRKINAFAAAMAGDPDAVVVDIWLLRAFDMDKKYYRAPKAGSKQRGQVRSSGATDKQYTEIETYVRQEAADMGLEPRQLAAMIWSGCRLASHPKDKESHYERLLRYHFGNMFNVI